MSKTILFAVWLIATFVCLDILLAGISAKDTIWNLSSLFGLIIYVYGSIKTKCFTNLIRKTKCKQPSKSSSEQ